MYRSSELLDEVYGNVTLQSATLVGALGNVPPTANITSPTNGQIFLTPTGILISADATDPHGSVSKVEFFENGNKLGEDTSYPYSFNWTNVALGTYTLTVRANDDLGSTTISRAVSVSVTNAPLLPVTLQNPRWSGGNFSFSFMTEADRTYDVLSATALGTNSWQVLTTLNGTGGLL